jgi:hypothetical protein
VYRPDLTEGVIGPLSPGDALGDVQESVHQSPAVAAGDQPCRSPMSARDLDRQRFSTLGQCDIALSCYVKDRFG